MSTLAAPTLPAKRPVRAELAVLLVAALFGGAWLAGHLHPYNWLEGDGSFYFEVSRGLVEHHTLVQNHIHPRTWYERSLGWNRNLDSAWSNVALGRDGHTWWPKHPVLMPIVAAPFVFAFGVWGTLLFNFLAFLLVPWLAYRISLEVAARGPSLLVAILLAASPVLTFQTLEFSNDLFYTVLLLGAVLLTLRDKPISGGLLLGTAVFAKATMVLLAPAVGLLLLLRRDWRGLARLSAAAALPTGLALALNAYMFGSPFATGYDRVLVRVNDVLRVHDSAVDFDWAHLGHHLASVLASPHGLLLRWPVFLLAAAGLLVLALRRRWGEVALLGLGMVVIVVFHAPFRWYRIAFVLPAIALSVPAAAAALSLRTDAEPPPRSVHRIRVGRLVAAVLLALLVVGGLRRAIAGPPASLADRIRSARVFLGDVPCDYFNNQNRRWECSGFDRGRTDLMTGVANHPELRYGGTPRRMIALSPHPTGRPRAIVFDVPRGARALDLVYGVADGGRAPVSFAVLVDGRVVFQTAARRGLARTRVEIPAGSKKLRLEVQGSLPSRFGVNGRFVTGK